MNIIAELNEQAEKIVKELVLAKRQAKENVGTKRAYHKGRAEELEKWLSSVENMITKILYKR